MSEKKRLDVLLTERGLQESRQRAQAVIMSGEVFVNGQRVDKPGHRRGGGRPDRGPGRHAGIRQPGRLKLEKARRPSPST